MRKLLVKLCLLLPVPLLVVAVNLLGDPAHLFRQSGYEQAAAAALRNGQAVVNFTGDDRLLELDYIAGLRQPKNVLVIGSSRSMQIRSNEFAGETFFNSSVNGASLQDDIAIYELYRSHNLQPKTLVIGLDPWLLNANSGQIRWHSIEPAYQAAMQRMGFPSTPSLNFQLSKAAELISPSYFQSSLQLWLLGGAQTEGRVTSINDENSDDPLLLSDGSYVYSKSIRTRTVTQVQQAATEYTESDPMYSLGQFDVLNAELVKQMEAFVAAVQGDGVRVVFYLPPYHPYVYGKLSTEDQYQTVLAAQAYFTQLAAQDHVTLLGSYNPAEVHCTEQDFYDGMHAKEACVARIFLALNAN